MKIILSLLLPMMLAITLFNFTTVNADEGVKDSLSGGITLAQEDEGEYFEDPEQYEEPDDRVYEDEENYEDYDDYGDEGAGEEIEEPYYPEEPAVEEEHEEPSDI